MEHDIRSGYFEGRYPWSVQGRGGKNLIILDGLRVENTAPEGLALQGLADTYKPLTLGRTVWTLGRRQGLREGMTIEDMADDLARVIRDLIPEPHTLMGMGLGGSIALEIAARHPDLVGALILISSGLRLTESGKMLYKKLFELALRLRWGSVHAELSKLLFLSSWSAFLGGLVARLFAPDLGTPKDPWDFLVAIQSELVWDGRTAAERVGCPVLVLHGSSDRLYDSTEVKEVWSNHPKAVCEVWNNFPHGLLKVDRDRVLDRIRAFLVEVEPMAPELGL